MRLTVSTLFVLLATPTLAQTPTIPAPVVAECNETASASELPDCLKGGAVAFELLDMVRSDEFYGPAAEPVLTICAERNETYSTQWTCFSNAAEKAAETGELIGLANIADTCVAGISDPALAVRIGEEYQRLRSERFPDGGYSGFTSYYPFQGCPAPVEEANAEDGAAPDDDEDVFSVEACAAYGELETVIQSTDTDGLRIIGEDLKALDDPDADEIAETTGLSEDAAALLLASRVWTH